MFRSPLKANTIGGRKASKKFPGGEGGKEWRGRETVRGRGRQRGEGESERHRETE